MNTRALVETVRDDAYRLMQEVQKLSGVLGVSVDDLKPKSAYILDLTDSTNVKVLDEILVML